jgi:5-methylthioadenosine/S-adenosylhomocysteine deaminase
VSDVTGRFDTLFHGGTVVTMDDERRILVNGAVGVAGNRIVAVAPAAQLAQCDAKRRINCTGRIVMPGLVDCHNHLYQIAGRGLGDGMALWKWLSDFMLPLSATISPTESLAAVRLGALEALSFGTTTVIDNHYAPADVKTTLAVAAALRDLGLRGVIARGMFGPFTEVARPECLSDALFQHDTAHEIRTMRECLEQADHDRFQIWPSPINIIYNDQALVEQSIGLAREFGVKWHTHCSEAPIDPDIYERAYGSRPITWLERQGLLDARATFAHAIWLDDAEVAAMGHHGVGVAHNPSSNAYLASGVIRLAALRDAGAVVGLGADGAAGHSMDLFPIMKQAVYGQRLATLNPESTNAHVALEMATRDGARLAGVDAGQLSAGKLADIIVLSTKAPAWAPIFDLGQVWCTQQAVGMSTSP